MYFRTRTGTMEPTKSHKVALINHSAILHLSRSIGVNGYVRNRFCGAIHYLFTYRLVESLWSSLTLISEFYDTLGETLATSLVTPTIAFFLSYKVENWLVFYQLVQPLTCP